MNNDMEMLAIFAGVFLVGPVLLAKLVVRASWRQIGLAYLILYGLLFLATSGPHGLEETFGWMLILGMFVTIPAIPLLCLLMKAIGYARRAV